MENEAAAAATVAAASAAASATVASVGYTECKPIEINLHNIR